MLIVKAPPQCEHLDFVPNEWRLVPGNWNLVKAGNPTFERCLHHRGIKEHPRAIKEHLKKIKEWINEIKGHVRKVTEKLRKQAKHNVKTTQ